MKIYFGGIDHETNVLSPIPTGLANFRENFLFRPSAGEGVEALKQVLAGSNLLTLARERGHDLAIGLIAAAHPSAPIGADDYQMLREELLEDLRRAGPVDAVILRLHGAMVAQGCNDCEGDILRAVRAVVGPGVPVGVLFDLHGNVTDAMLEHATLLIACKEYPHTDFQERAVQLLGLIERAVAGQCRPVMRFARAPMFGLFQTTREPMRTFVDRLTDFETGKVLAISVTHGFLWNDTPHVGAGVLVVTDMDAGLASELASTLAQELFALRERVGMKSVSVDAALDAAVGESRHLVILADVDDNPGGGAGGDSTHILREILRRELPAVALGMIHDPEAVQQCLNLGVGRKLRLDIGGKSGGASGGPVRAEALVSSVSRDHWQWAMGVRDGLGAAAAIRVDGVEIVLTTARQQVLSPECFTNLGIDLGSKGLVVVKSALHFRATFDALSELVLFVAAIDAKQRRAELNHLPRPLWPLDSPPFDAYGRIWE